MEKRVITVTLNPAVDRTVTVDGFATGGVFVKGHEQVTAGGKGVNVSRALNALGVNNLATGILGGCSGKVTLIKLLREERVNQDFYKFGGYTRTNVTIFDPHAGRTTQLLELGPKLTELQSQEFLIKFKEKLKSCSFLVLSGRSAVGLPDGFYADLIKLAHEHSIAVLLDTHDRPLQLALAEKPLMVTPNLAEAEELLGRSFKTLAAKKKALIDIHEQGASLVFIKLGMGGVIAYNGKHFLQATSPTVKIVNDVGCGDALSAGLVSAYFKKMDFSKMLAYAVAAAAASALTPVPGLLNKNEMKKILSKTKVIQF